MKQGMLTLLALLVTLGLATRARAQEAELTRVAADPSLAAAGKRLFRRRCAMCHGTGGRGDGPVSRYVFPKPRDLTTGIFKIRSTPTGGLPTDQDLFQTVTRGMPGTTMPAWSNLSETERWQLVAYVKTLSPWTQTEEGFDPIEIGKPPPPLPESVANGRRLFILAECWTCHGMLGKGDGPSSRRLKDDWGHRIVPADLTVARNWRGGHRPEDIFRSISVGIGGTPMPSFGDALSEEQIWDLVNYLLSNIRR